MGAAIVCSVRMALADDGLVLPTALIVSDEEVADWASETRARELEEELKKILAAGNYRPALREVFRDGTMVVKRGSGNEDLSSLFEPFSGREPAKLKLKTIGISENQTRVRYEASGNGIQQTAEFSASWQGREFAGLEVVSFEEVTGALKFKDRTASVFKGEDLFENQFMRGVDHWRGRLMLDFGVDPNGMQGIALGDANGDGLEDLYVCQQGGLPDRLFLRNADGTLKDVSNSAGVDWLELTRAALFIDLDNDGDQDLALSQGWYYVLMENDGEGKFTKRVEERSEADLHSLSAADYDLDGDLDLYFAGRNPASEKGVGGVLGQPTPYHDANNGGPGILLRNEGQFQFTDVTQTSGIDENNRRYSYACSWQDFDLDGDPDLYVANDFGRNNLYRNDKGRFTDVAEKLGVEDLSAGMGITWGDFDNNGRPDAYVSNMFSGAGNRIAYQRRFREGGNDRADFQRHARGNTLFQNTSGGFVDLAGTSGTSMARWAWGAKFADLNNDGWQDLYVGNGFITTEDTGDL
ncbi:MAG: FG-GAP repeat domain-containing protein [Akkermansiaceae bacterium]